AAVVLFAAQAVVARPFGAAGALAPFAAHLPGGETDIAAAIRLGRALLPTGGARRLVLISDGQETTGQARDEARLAAADGVPISVVPLHTGAEHEVAVESVTVP